MECHVLLKCVLGNGLERLPLLLQPWCSAVSIYSVWQNLWWSVWDMVRNMEAKNLSAGIITCTICYDKSEHAFAPFNRWYDDNLGLKFMIGGY